jgi:starch phosphorylase
MGLEPAVCHMNEGHSAFLALERIAGSMREHGLSFAEAFEVVRAGGIFTTHTAVPAGFDVFPLELVDKYFGRFLRDTGISRHQLLALGRSESDGEQTAFNMAALALRASAFANGVSEIHGEVSRNLLAHYVPSVPAAELPVGHVTNGAHTRSCVSREMSELFDRYLGPDWWRRPGQAETWAGVDSIPDEELWATHERRRERLVAFARQRLTRQLAQRGASQRELEHGRGALDTRALTIGFARRFATYKRANLILADLARLEKILLDPDRPVQILFAGKAHPRDSEAKEVMKAVVAFCQQPQIRRHAVFIEDYDLVVARYLVQGCDVWLNTPRRGQEASGTSGMKVLPNGGLNLSILDGWWCEGYRPEAGWAIGRGEDYADHAYQDYVESCALYELLEHDILPLFYGRGEDRLPRAWIARMKASMKHLTWRFSTNRMIWEYSERFYLPAANFAGRMAADGFHRAHELARWKAAIFHGWEAVRVEEVHALSNGVRRVGEGYVVEARVRLGALGPQDVCVELHFGELDAQRRLVAPRSAGMQRVGEAGEGAYLYRGEVPCTVSGMHGYTVRVRPCHPDANNLLATGQIAWW